VRLQTEAWARVDLSHELTGLACLAVFTGLEDRKSWEGMWLQGTGKTWKALKEFPGRLRRMADEVERLNANQFFRPKVFINPTLVSSDRHQAVTKMKSFYQLPTVLRSYAEALSQHSAKVPRKFPPRPWGRSRWVCELSDLTELATGKPHHEQVASLLSAAANVLNEKVAVDAVNIAETRSRRKKRTKKLA